MGAQTASRSVVVIGVAPPHVRIAVASRLERDGWICAGEDETSPDAVVLLELDPDAMTARAFRDTDETTWERFAELPPKRTLAALQRVHATRRSEGCVVVMVQPAVAMEGAAGLTASTTGWEAQRQLVKSVARRWGRDGIRATIVGAAPELVGQPPPDALRTERAAPDTAGLDALADTVALVLRPEAAALTGATVVADGGALMLP